MVRDQRAKLYGKIRKWGSVGFIVGVFTIGAILEIIPISMLPILLLIIASLAFIWAFTIREPEGAPTSQKHLEPLLPVLKRPEVAAFFTIEFILLFHMHLFIASIAIF